MLRLQTTKPTNSNGLDLDDLADDQSFRMTTKKIVADAKVNSYLIFRLFSQDNNRSHSIPITFLMKSLWIMETLRYDSK